MNLHCDVCTSLPTPTSLPLPIIRAPSEQTQNTMEAERINQIDATLARLHTRLNDLRRFL